MQTFGRQIRRKSLTAICLMILCNKGCTLTGGFIASCDLHDILENAAAVPVPAYASQLMEDKLYEDERYNRVPVLIRWKVMSSADPPSEDQVMRALPEDGRGGLHSSETQLNNVRIVVEPLVDRLDECKGIRWSARADCITVTKCTIYYDKTIRSYWPIPFTHVDQSEEVVYIDKDHLIRCAGPTM